jgi:hypothetical protein
MDGIENLAVTTADELATHYARPGYVWRRFQAETAKHVIARSAATKQSRRGERADSPE